MGKHQKIEAFYEQFWADADYQLLFAYYSAVQDRFPAIQAVWRQMLPPGRLLDYGCGNGVLTFWMFCNGFGVESLGIDISHTAIDFAQCRFSRPGLSFRTFDPDQPLDGLGRFDVVVSSHVLEHIPDPRRALAQLLPLSDWFLIEVPLERCLVQDAAAALLGKERKENSLGHLHFWTRKSFRKLLKSCGLLVVRDFQYASAPFSLFNSLPKRFAERLALSLLGTQLYGYLMATHYIVLAYRHPLWRERIGATTPDSGMNE